MKQQVSMWKRMMFLVAALIAMVNVAQAENVAQAIYCRDAATLYFTYQEQVTAGSDYDGHHVTEVWSGDDVLNSGDTYTPEWAYKYRDEIKKVKFINSFESQRPKSMDSWFWGCDELEEIEGIEYLNTSQVTTMKSAFHVCSKLTSIDLTHFDVSSLTNARSMFYGCDNLETIYCNKSWDMTEVNGESMFWACTNLKTPSVSYDSGRTDGDMACTFSGYFTTTPEIEGNGTVEKPFLIASADHWNLLADYLTESRTARNMHFRQTADFTVTKMIGSMYRRFEGIYDGDVHVIYADIDNGVNKYTGIFAHVGNATIKNLYVGGTIKGGAYAAAVVGEANADQGCLIENCSVKATVTIVDGYRAGGIVGHANHSNLTIKGCSFGGTIKTVNPDQGQAAGAMVGQFTSNHLTIEDCFEYGSYNDFESGSAMVCPLTPHGTFNSCYSSNQFDDAIQAKKVTDESGLVAPVVTGDKPVYNTGLMVVDSGVIAQEITEIEEKEGGQPYDVDADVVIYVKPNDNFYFTSDYAVTAKTTTEVNPQDITVHGLGNKDNPYYITMSNTGDYGVTIEITKKVYALLINDSKTLVFEACNTQYAKGDTYNYKDTEYTINEVWTGNDVLNTGTSTPKWKPGTEGEMTKLKEVAFTEGFKSVKPKSMYQWFSSNLMLSTIEGIENLNTSEVTTMNSAFAGCASLTAININTFDTGKLTNTNSMFSGCINLKSIYCSQTWNVETSNNMFLACVSVQGAVSYSNSKTGGSMANPKTGYFTTTATPHAIWCQSNHTLYFDTPESDVNAGGTYEGRTASLVWRGDEVTGATDDAAPWVLYSPVKEATKVVVKDGFASVKLKHMNYWFAQFGNLTEIEGIQNLNTSEMTSAFATFAECDELTSLDLSTWDMSNVTDATQMFYGCEKLETITTNQTWKMSVPNSHNMFYNCTELKGAIDYSGGKTDARYANPINGYFTTTDGKVTGAGSTQEDPKMLNSTTHWQALANFVAAGRAETNYLYYKLGRSIRTDSIMVGTEDYGFAGFFDGGGNAIEVDIDTDKDYAAPFRYVTHNSSDATYIVNLVVMGKVKTSKKYAGTIVGKAMKTFTLNACQSFAELNSTVDGEGGHGGMVGEISGENQGVQIYGSVFSGKLTGSKTTAVGGFVGKVTDGASAYLVNNLFVPAKVTMSSTNSYTLKPVSDGSIVNCYYVQALGTEQGNRAYEIDNEDKYLTLQGKNSQKSYEASRLYFAGSNGDEGIMVEVLDEWDDGELEGDMRIFAQSGASVKISSEVTVTFKDEDDNAVSTTGAGTTGDPYAFTMPGKNVKVEATGLVAYAIWCFSNNTLYFDATETPISMNEKYDGQTITAMWTGGNVTSVGWSTPGWSNTASKAEKVVFKEGFKDVTPNSLNRWFMNYKFLEEVEGIENLNTSKVTTMNSAFFSCEKLTRLDIDGFDTSSLTNTSAMFRNCEKLKTIFCDNTWTLENENASQNMFDNCPKLVGAIEYSPTQPKSVTVANPTTGYFTKKELILMNGEDNSYEIEKFDGIKDVNVSFEGRTFARTGYWNTVVLPFDLKIDGTAFGDATARELDVENTYGEQNKETGFDPETGTLYLYFKEPTDELKAGVPYIIKWEGFADNLENPTFMRVTIDAKAVEPVKSKDERVEFIGSYYPVTFTANDKETRYLGSTNNVVYPNSAVTMKSHRAYFHVDLGSAQDVNSIAFEYEDTPTGIGGVQEFNSSKVQGAYTLDGRKLNGEPASNGVYISNGVKVIK